MYHNEFMIQYKGFIFSYQIDFVSLFNNLAGPLYLSNFVPPFNLRIPFQKISTSRQKSGKSISFLFDSLLLSFVDRITFTSLFSLVHPFVGLGQLFLFDGTSQAKYKNGIFGMSWALFVSSFIQGFHRISEQTGLLNSFNTMINK